VRHEIDFSRGFVQNRLIEVVDGVEVSPMRVVGATDKRGTKVHFLPDQEIFKENFEFHYEILAKRLRELSFLNNGVRIRLKDERTARKTTSPSPAASRASWSSSTAPRRCCTPPPSTPRPRPARPRRHPGTEIGVEVAMQWNDSYAEQVLCFTNNIPSVTAAPT
jgi:DNA gyrase subunit B